MKTRLLYRDRDFLLDQPPAPLADSLAENFELGTLLDAMAAGDPLVREVAQKALLAPPETDLESIGYRQAILKDCLENPDVIRALYRIAQEALERKRGMWLGVFSHHPSGILIDGVNVLALLNAVLRKLRATADEHAASFCSEGFTTLFATLQRELADDFFDSVEAHLKRLRFRRGVLLSARLGEANGGTDYVLRKSTDMGPVWLEWLMGGGRQALTLQIDPRDEAGARYLWQIRDRGINLVANAVGQAADHVLGFFQMLQTELAFYVGCLNLRDALAALGEAVCFPRPYPARERRFRCRELYDPTLALKM